MRARACLGAMVLAVATFAGCEWKSERPAAAVTGAVAVIDLDAIARSVGSDKLIAKSITDRQTALNQKIVELAKSYNEQIAEKKKAISQVEAKQVEVQLTAWQQQAETSIKQVKEQAASDIQNHRTKLVAQFREEVKPAARRVAQRRGLSVIVTKNDAVVFDFTNQCDITEDVVKELLAGSPAPAVAAPTTTP